MAPDIAWHSAHTGDLETARRYMLHALSVEDNSPLRRYICGQLAWLEDDPEVAAALLETACSADNGLELRNAIEFAQATQNHELEQYFRDRAPADWENITIYNYWLGTWVR